MICSQCGKNHPADAMEPAFRRPDLIANMDPRRRAREVQENDDLCIVGGTRYFLRVVLPLPVIGRDKDYAIGLWVEIEKAARDRILELWSAPDQGDEPPFEGRIANDIPFEPSMLGLPVRLQLMNPPGRAQAFMQPCGHPLFEEQTKGISMHRLHEYAALCA